MWVLHLQLSCDFHLHAISFSIPSLSFFFFLFKKKIIYLFILFWLHWVFVDACRLSLAGASGGCSSLRCVGFSLWCLLLLQSTGSRYVGFSSCCTQAQQLWCTGLVAPRHVGSSGTSPHFQSVCVPRSEVGFLQTTYIRVLFLYPFSRPVSFGWSF